MNQIFRKTILLFFFYLSANCQEFLPSPYPDRITLTLAGEPSTTQTVTWRTDISVTKPKVEYRLEDSSPKTEGGTLIKDAKTRTMVTKEGRTDHYHYITMSGLSPNTQYMYRVGDGTHWSEWMNFRTARPKSSIEPFSFIYLGDAQNDLKSRWSRAIRTAYSHQPNAKFILHAGDLINRANTDSEWGEWHYAAGHIHGTMPAIPTPGNHEYFRDSLRTLFLDPHWAAQFTLPENGPEGHQSSVFYIDYQNVRVISLNSQLILLDEKSLKVQKEWLEKVLKENTQKWVIVMHHHPVYSTAKNRDNKEIRELFKPVYDKYGVDLVLQGHDHTYARGKGPDAGKNTPMYMVSVSGPKMYQSDSDRWMDTSLTDTQLYQIVDVSDRKIEVKTFKLTGELFDSFELEK